MAGRILNRRELRKQADQAEQLGADVADATPAVAPGAKKAKASADTAALARPLGRLRHGHEAGGHL
jgi:hypothetical protein